MLQYIVSKTLQDDNCFPTVNDAISALPSNADTPVTILIKPGIYHEKIELSRPNTILLGEDAACTTLTFDEILPLRNIIIEIRCDKKPERIMLQPENKALDFEYGNGLAILRLEKIELYDIIIVDN